MTSLFVSAFTLAIAICASPGTVNIEAARRGLARGFRPALYVGLGSLIGDAVWAVIALGGAAFLVQYLPIRLVLGTVGVLIVGRLAWGALCDAAHGPQLDAKATSGRSAFPTGMLLSLGNPFAIAFWLGVGGTTVAAWVPQAQWGDYVTFLGAFMSGAVLWCLVFAGLVSWGRQFINGTFFRWVSLLCGLFLAHTGLRLAWDTLQMMGLI